MNQGNANTVEEETLVYPRESVRTPMDSKQQEGYGRLLKSMRKQFFELKFEFPKIDHSKAGHESMEETLMQVNFFPSSYS